MTEQSQNRAKVAVFGGGSFGTALSYVLSKNPVDVVILTRNPNVASSINEQHKNSSYLTDFVLPDNIRATNVWFLDEFNRFYISNRILKRQ